MAELKNRITTKTLLYVCAVFIAGIFLVNAVENFSNTDNVQQQQTKSNSEPTILQNEMVSNDELVLLAQENRLMKRELLAMKTSVEMLRNELANIREQMASSLNDNSSQHISQNLIRSDANNYSSDDLVVGDADQFQFESTFMTLDNSLYEEEIDLEWSSALDFQFRELLNQPEMNGVALVNQECGTTLCRLEVSFSESDILAEDIDEILAAAIDAGEGLISLDETTSAATIYLSKEGHGLPITK